MAKNESIGLRKKLKMQKERSLESRLPTEMLTEIFKYLNVRERKVIKQVCKRWNDACNVKQITDTEKFFFSGLYPTDKILGILSKSRNNYFNLEFQKTNFMFPDKFWDKCGSKVVSITLINCRMSKETMEKLVINCTNLSSLAWKHETESNQPFLDAAQFQTLMEKNIVRKKLQYLEISVVDCWVSAQLLCNIFSVFPSIINFTIYVTWTQLIPLIPQLEELSTQNSEVFRKLELRFSGYSPIFREKNYATTALNTVKITELPPFQYDSFDSVSNLKCISKNLESFQCFASNSESGTFVNFVSTVLRDCPKLRLLEMYSDNERDIFSREFLEQLLNSSLDTLLLRYLPPLFEQDVFLGDALPINRTIKSLCIRCALDDPDTSSLITFLSMLINLEHLSLNYVSNAVLKHVWESHTNLKSLSLCVGNFWKRDEFFGKTADGESAPEVHTFKNLLYLKLESVDIWPLEGIMNSIDVPNLRFLELRNLSYISFEETIISNLAARLPALEYLTLSHVNASYEQWCSCISGLKKLRFLRIEHKENTLFSRTECEQLFRICPSLRILGHSDGKRTESYYYDILQKKVIQKYLLGEYKFTSEKLSTLCGHWAGPDGMKFIEADFQFIDDDSDYENDSFLYSDSDYEFSFSEEDELMLAVMGDSGDEDRYLYFHGDELIDENDDWL